MACEHGACEEVRIFGSRSIGVHLIRGAIGFSLIASAFALYAASPYLSVGVGALALVAWKGCPMCWTFGLIETISSRR